jgi:small GTP-binding protein
MPDKSLLFKVLTAGEGGVGKTTLLYRYVKGKFLDDTKMTLGVGFFLKELAAQNLKVTLQLWDFGGQDRFQFLHETYSEGAKGAILMYDLTRPSTLDHIDYWVNVCRKENPGIPIIFIGGKSDLTDLRVVREDMIEEVMKKYDFCDHLEVSSKTGENVEKVFESLAEYILST